MKLNSKSSAGTPLFFLRPSPAPFLRPLMQSPSLVGGKSWNFSWKKGHHLVNFINYAKSLLCLFYQQQSKNVFCVFRNVQLLAINLKIYPKDYSNDWIPKGEYLKRNHLSFVWEVKVSKFSLLVHMYSKKVKSRKSNPDLIPSFECSKLLKIPKCTARSFIADQFSAAKDTRCAAAQEM